MPFFGEIMFKRLECDYLERKNWIFYNFVHNGKCPNLNFIRQKFIYFLKTSWCKIFTDSVCWSRIKMLWTWICYSCWWGKLKKLQAFEGKHFIPPTARISLFILNSKRGHLAHHISAWTAWVCFGELLKEEEKVVGGM